MNDEKNEQIDIQILRVLGKDLQILGSFHVEKNGQKIWASSPLFLCEVFLMDEKWTYM